MTKDQTPVAQATTTDDSLAGGAQATTTDDSLAGGAQATTTDDTLAGGAIVQAEITLDQAQIQTALENIAAQDETANDTLAGGDAQAGKAEQGIPSTSNHPTLAQMRAAIEMIEGGNNAFGREALQHVIERECGTAGELMTEDLQPSGVFEVAYLGITATSPVSIEVALTVWCSKARRAILAGIYSDEPADEPAADAAE